MFREAGFMADVSDDQGSTLNKKIRSAQLAQYNYIFGKDESWKATISAVTWGHRPTLTKDVNTNTSLMTRP